MNDASIGTRQYDVNGPSIHGLILEGDKMMGVNDWVISANLEISVSKVLGKPFIDLGIVEGLDPYFDFGIKKSFGPLVIIIPLYQNWDAFPYVKDAGWILDRMRFSLSVSNFNILRMF